MDPFHELEVLLRARTRLLAVDSIEEDRVRELLVRVADALEVPFYRWTLTRGLEPRGGAPIYDTKDPERALRNVAALDRRGVFLLKDLAPLIGDPVLARALKDVITRPTRHPFTVVLTAARVEVPDLLSAECARFTLELPTKAELSALAWGVISEYANGAHVQVSLDGERFEAFVDRLRGLTRAEARRAVGRAIADDMALTEGDLDQVLAMKREMLRESGALAFVAAEGGMAEVGGLAALKRWLVKRRGAFTAEARDFGLEPPRGVILLGVQGCGKSLAAKAVAGDWKLPLLRLEPGRLFDKFIGESEKRLERALQAAEHMAPCVLWIDEIEKGFAGLGDSTMDGGVSQRMFGRLLGWMQERSEAVFVVATCNDVTRIPPELMRKGRFDEVFFIDLPDAADRAAVLALHLRARERDPAGFDLERLAVAADGFSGAELEQVVVSGLYTAFAAERPLDTAILLAEIEETQPLSVTRAEDVARLRRWAKGRAVPAG